MLSRSLESLRIIVVDDDPQIREIIGRCLILFGASVTLCEDASAAIETIKQTRPDVVLVDLIMPDRDGLYLLHQIRSWGTADGGDVPAVVITGLRDPSLENELREAGFGYLAKPFAPIKLFNSITEVLDPVPSLERHLASFPMVVSSTSP
jgi:CheY-like chemotaxis protein